MRTRAAAAWAVGVCLSVLPAAFERAGGAEVVISINKATQSMSVLVDGVEQHHWAISSGLGGGPHNGTYSAGRMERKWFSRKYNWAPMPYSIFFDGNYAIHGTIHVKRLGRRASKGCVRLHPVNAAKLFELVRVNHDTTRIVVSDSTHVAAMAPAAEPVPPPPKTETAESNAMPRAGEAAAREAMAAAIAPAAETASDTPTPGEAQPPSPPAASAIDE
jgi:hypothetical protein